jgi:hypothetical protein
MCRAKPESGELVTILSDYQLDPVDVNAAFRIIGFPRGKAFRQADTANGREQHRQLSLRLR